MTALHRHKQWCVFFGSVLALAVLAGCSAHKPAPKPPAYQAAGKASYYGKKFHGRRTASGERYNMHGLTAAHRHLAFGTRVRVTHLRSGRTVTVRINDRGPFIKGRIIDLSQAAARKLGMLVEGVARVRVTSIP